MADSAALLVDEVLPHQPMRQWVLSVPFPLRFLFASKPAVMGKVLGIIYCTIATHLTHKAGFIKPLARTGAVTLIQRFGGAPGKHLNKKQRRCIGSINGTGYTSHYLRCALT